MGWHKVGWHKVGWHKVGWRLIIWSQSRFALLSVRHDTAVAKRCAVSYFVSQRIASACNVSCQPVYPLQSRLNRIPRPHSKLLQDIVCRLASGLLGLVPRHQPTKRTRHCSLPFPLAKHSLTLAKLKSYPRAFFNASQGRGWICFLTLLILN